MFSNFIVAFNTVFPLCLLIALGLFLKRRGAITDTTQKEGNSIVFKALLPFLIFKNIFYTDLDTEFDIKLVLFCIGIVFVQYALSTILALSIEKDIRTRGAIIHSVFRTNSLIYGLAILLNMYNPEQLGSSSIALALILPFTNGLAVFTLEKYRGGKASAKNIAIGIAKNPVIIATVVALFFRGVGISNFPQFINAGISTIASLTTPMALLFIGASLELSKIKDNSKNLVIGIVCRLVILPAIIITIAIATGFRGIDLATIMTICAGPTAVTAYTMAASMDSNADLTGEMVTFTTMLSCLTIFLWIFALMQMGFI